MEAGAAIKLPTETIVRMRVTKAAREAVVPGRKKWGRSLYKADALKYKPNGETLWGASFKIPGNEFFSLPP